MDTIAAGSYLDFYTTLSRVLEPVGITRIRRHKDHAYPISWKAAVVTKILVRLLILAAFFTELLVTPAYAARGDLVATVTFSQSCGSGIGVGIAYDGTNLWYSCYNSSPDLYRADPVTGQVTASYTIAGGLGALAYDANRNAIWAGWGGLNTGQVYLIQLDGSKNVVPPTAVAFNATDATISEIDDGLAYDGQTDSLYISPDGSTVIHHYDTNGNHLIDGPNQNGDFTWAGNSCYNSGLAIGGNLLYEGSDGCSHVWVVDKTNPTSSVFNFSTGDVRDEDLECDTNTFASQGKHVMWSKEAYEPMRAHAFEIDFGSCGVGGNPAPQPGGKRPVIIIPGIMGSELDRQDNSKEVWLDTSLLIERFDSFLFPLLLQQDGLTPDTNSRCAGNKNVCSSNSDCPLFENCVGGGATMMPHGPLSNSYTAYTDLENYLRDHGGYIEDTNLFVFGYDWRLDLKSQADAFNDYLNKNVPDKSQKVDVIAHSMGGLLIRAYLDAHPDDQRIASITYLGTPQQGAPMSYAKLIGAASLVDRFNGQLGTFLWKLNLDTETFLVQNFPSAYELLPRFNFVLTSGNSGSSFEPIQTSFERLSNSMLVTKANDLYSNKLAGPGVIPRSFAIDGTQHRTLDRLDYTNPKCPKGLSDPTGDGTVPSVSSGLFLNQNAYMYVDEEHAALPANGAVQQQILNILDGNENVKAQGILTSPIADSDGWRWFSCSPIRTHVTDEAGNTNGLDADGNLHEEINDSTQLRFTENEGGFLPFDKTYTVNIDATDNGLFTLQFDHLASPNDDISGSTSYVDIPISIKSHAHLILSATNTAPDLFLDINGDGIDDFTISANTPPNARIYSSVLVNVVQNFTLSKGISQSLLAKLNAATAALGRGSITAARGQLGAFLSEVAAQRGKQLSEKEGATLTTLGEAALHAI